MIRINSIENLELPHLPMCITMPSPKRALALVSTVGEITAVLFCREWGYCVDNWINKSLGPGDNFTYIKLIEDESMFMYMNYPVSVWFSVDSSPDKVYMAIYNKHRVPWPQREVMWNGILVAERGKLLSFSDNADMCLGGICMFLFDFFFFSHRKSIDTSSI